MGRRYVGIGLLVGILFSLTGHLFAQRIGVVADGAANVEIRTAPPHGPFNLLRGTLVRGAAVEPGNCVVILSERTFNGFQGTHVWYEIGPVDADSDVGQGWWLYAGVKNAAGRTPVIRVDETADVDGYRCPEGGS